MAASNRRDTKATSRTETAEDIIKSRDAYKSARNRREAFYSKDSI